MPRIPTPSVEFATGTTAAAYDQIRKAAGSAGDCPFDRLTMWRSWMPDIDQPTIL